MSCVSPPPHNPTRAISIGSLSRVVLYLVIVVVFATPYLWIVGSTFKTRQDLFDDLDPVSIRTFVPINPTLENLTTLFTETNFAQAFLNSVVVATMSVTFAGGDQQHDRLRFGLAQVSGPASALHRNPGDLGRSPSKPN